MTFSLSNFTHEAWLAFLAVIALAALIYILMQQRRRRHVLRFSNMELLEKVAPRRPRAWRHVPVAITLVGLIFLTFAAAGPTAAKKVPRNRATVILVIDVSLSMKATDVPPSRIEVAQKAAKEFADNLTPGINLGLVTFAGTAAVQVSPTTNREAVKAAIDHMNLAERTATGEGILTALQSIDTLASVLGGAEKPPPAQIVLMSDGKQTVPDDKDTENPRHGFTAARLAKEKGIPVSTISFGTTWGTVEIPDTEGKGAQRVRVPVDDDSLREIAKLSGGEFFTASTLEELKNVYGHLEEQIGYERTIADASRPWVLVGLLVTAAGLIAALLYRQRLP
ncbi:VWA domain-containing protein [Nocardia seriolae]|uniref:VWFA domain-containing protein n=1 Tax=Nocardia seriolae TaxID=37332 RepID=A0A0B8NE87_9NOCA|nr:VWA domain-containing protein [Nocardia seriolae]MTJ63993.1 VWA domain-containing protein [Nocardia seriolae]MTJ71339.1 VWA domain-containing protein [Nocardia seriolae]MTJ88554.1 VWA domain-containing protein [Nocardia seriolae]MTK32538.1 VWA domain-containing protein [Nocardia seriolae]MTK41879.1 VWA domain-containing protein [Nocardia seriolae]